MAEIRSIEGTRDELQEKLQSFPKEQRFRVIPIPLVEEGNGAVAETLTLAELFAGRVGRFHFGDANLSQSSSEKFAALMAEKKRQGRL